jgi:type VI secretion system protein ImpK
MTPVELCEPLFQFVCRLNRSARKGGDHDMDQVRSEVKGILADIMSKASADPALANQFDYDHAGRGHDRSKGQLYIVLLFFVDFMIRNSSLRWAMDWNNLADEVGEQAGDEKFFELLDETLAQRSDAANQRLAVYYTCMGLGFSGWYTAQPEYLRKKMLECAARLRGVVNADESSKVCPEAYERTNTSNLIEKPASSLVGIGIALVVLVLMTLVANAYLYERSASNLSDALKRVMNSGSGATTTQ